MLDMEKWAKYRFMDAASTSTLSAVHRGQQQFRAQAAQTGSP